MSRWDSSDCSRSKSTQKATCQQSQRNQAYPLRLKSFPLLTLFAGFDFNLSKILIDCCLEARGAMVTDASVERFSWPWRVSVSLGKRAFRSLRRCAVQVGRENKVQGKQHSGDFGTGPNVEGSCGKVA